MIPLVESMPSQELKDFFAKEKINTNLLRPGDEYTVFHIKDNLTFITSICYESLFVNYLRDYLNALDKAPHFLVNISDNSWLGKSVYATEQSFLLSKWNAAALQIPLIRVDDVAVRAIR